MKTDIHPAVNMNATATCVCGAQFVVSSVLPEIQVEICSNCHPLYTGQEKVLDAAGRVERFKQRAAAAGSKKASVKKGK